MDKLTDRQKSVLAMAMAGMTRPEAAKALGITEQGIDRHVELIAKKGVDVRFRDGTGKGAA